MLKLAPLKRNSSSTKQVDIEGISDGILKLPGNRYRIVLLVSPINFELKSEEEQDAIIDTYEGFLNSIGFAIQILVRTREIDMDDYLESLKSRIEEEAIKIYKTQITNYSKFISSLISSNKILSRQFYVIIPYDLDKNSDHSIVRDQLSLRADIVAKNLSRLGINCRQLGSIEIIDLFYSFYSPEHAKTQPIGERALEVINSEFLSKA